MSDDGRQRGMGGGQRRGRLLRTPRVGDPNVLTGAATPNQLSSQVGVSGSPVPVPSRPLPSSQALTPRPVANVTYVPTQPRTPDADPTQPRGRRLPSVSVLIFLGFAALTGFRLLGQFADEQGVTPTPTSTPPAAAESRAPGLLEFGLRQNDDCEIEEPASAFAAGDEVWWVAQLSTFQAPDGAVTVLYHHEGVLFDREDVPGDPSIGKWDTLCSGGPVARTKAGGYRVEVWNEDRTVLLAQGSYEVGAAP